jgi:two-component sensor histidine kinase
VVLSIQDLTERRRSERRETLLMREVDHRAKNMLAVLRAALRLTRAGNRQELVEGLDGRIAALARAQTALAERHWDHAGLRALLEGELSPAPGAGEARALLEGPEVALPPDTAQPLALAVHELAANAMQHGALSVPEGRLRVTWRVEDGLLQLLWEERGGPAPEGPPARRGFGLRLLETTLNRQLGGRVAQRWTPGGLQCEIALPVGRDAEAALAAE